MSYFHEFEPYMEDFLEYGLGAGLLSNSFSSLLGIASYVLTALALYTLAQRRGIKNPWLSWIPVINCWIIGSLSDQYRYVVKGEIKNKRKTLLILNILNMVLGFAMIIAVIVMVVTGFQSAFGSGAGFMSGIMGMVFGVLACVVPMGVIGIVTVIIRFMALYDIYTSCAPQNNVLYLVLSILFRITEPFFLFLCREKDDGMPPRRSNPTYESYQ